MDAGIIRLNRWAHQHGLHCELLQCAVFQGMYVCMCMLSILDFIIDNDNYVLIDNYSIRIFTLLDTGRGMVARRHIAVSYL